MKHALVVEDIEESRYLLQAVLEGNGYRVTTACNGVQALEAAHRCRPNIILSDVLMPQMDGFELCKAWMADDTLKHIPFIFYSATYTHPADAKLALALGAVRYLVKPLEPQELLNEIDVVLNESPLKAAHDTAAPMEEQDFHSLHDAALTRKLQDKIAQLETANLKLGDSERRYHSLFDQTNEGLLILTQDGKVCAVNHAFAKMHGYSVEEIEQAGIAKLSVTGEKALEHHADVAHRIHGGEVVRFELEHFHKDGHIFPLGVTASEIELEGQLCYLAFYQDITERRVAQKKIQVLAFYDSLTGLANRRLLMNRLQQALAASTRHKRQGALLFIDLDHFKDINDTVGHADGDLLLDQTAKRISAGVREGDTVSRLGGDEFVVLLEDLSESTLEAATQAKLVAEKVLQAINQSYALTSGARHCTASIGIAMFGCEQEAGSDAPLRQADLAMYQAKASGRNSIRFYEPNMQAVVSARTALEAGLREALEKNQFILHYQAQVTDVHQITGVEALVRWLHPTRGTVAPGEFIDLAEKTGLILPLGEWVLETACAQLVSWAGRAEMAHLTVAVNVSARQVKQDDFVDLVRSVLERTGANPHRLKLELTESLLVFNVEETIAKMRALKDLGVGFSLDDFGTGYSSLAYLKRLPLDQLKIDQGFVRDILIDTNDAAIARMVIALAGTIGLNVIAEGVESEEQREFLAQLGCNHCQGFLFARPLPVEELEAYLQKKSHLTEVRSLA